MTSHRWLLSDGTDTYQVHLNPLSGGSGQIVKQLTLEQPTAPEALPILFQGPDEPESFSVSGTILERDHYLQLRDWAKKNRELTLSDDLGRMLSIFIKAFRPQRVHSATYPWRHTYTIDAVILETLDEGDGP